MDVKTNSSTEFLQSTDISLTTMLKWYTFKQTQHNKYHDLNAQLSTELRSY